MYHVIGTGITAVLLYLISYLFYRLNYFSFSFHKKLWNAILAVAFLATTAAGVFMALQINYKWDLPFVKTVLKWHVEFGIGMAFTGLFHFVWHLSYFTRIFERQKSITEAEELHSLSFQAIRLNLFVVGLVSSSIQLLLMREMLNISGGYELVAGVFLGSWLIGSSFGASLAGSSKLTDLRKINLIFSFSPLFSLVIMFFLSRMFLGTGETPSFFVSLIYTSLVLLPFCMVSGFTFVKLIAFARTGNKFTAGKSFSIETIGGVAAGILIPLLTSGILNTYQILLLVILLSMSYVLISYYLDNQKLILFFKIGVLILSSLLILMQPDVIFRQLLLPGLKVKGTVDTPYGNITYGEYKGEKSTYYDQRLLTYNHDVIEREENIHYAMLQSDSPQRIILIAGSLSSQLPELLKYPIRQITFIERDPELTKAWNQRTDTLNVSISVISSDAFRYIRKEGNPADVIIMSVPPPSTLQLNRYYTTEFFTAVRKRLSDGGVFMCSPGPGNDYFNRESIELYSSVFNSLSAVFRNVKPVMGGKLYFIASDKELSVSFCNMAQIKKINNVYVSRDYLADDLISKKTEEITGLMDRRVRENKASFPVACYNLQSYNFSMNRDEKTPAVILMILVFAAPLILIRRRYILMYFSASALAGFEIIILLTLQITIGNMYQLSGLVIAGLMAGLAVGSGARIRWFDNISLAKKGILLLLVYLITGLSYNLINEIIYELTALVFILLLSFIPALLTGRLFHDLTIRTEDISSTSKVYSADLAGSAMGFILVSGIAIPVLGIKTSFFLLSALILTGLLLGTVRNKL